MTEVVACPKCEAEVRPGSVFCYNCGGRITFVEESPAPTAERIETVITDNKPTQPAPGLRSARDIRRREREAERKPKEIRWEAAVDSDWQLVIITAAVLVFTVVVIVLALYLK